MKEVEERQTEHLAKYKVHFNFRSRTILRIAVKYVLFIAIKRHYDKQAFSVIEKLVLDSASIPESIVYVSYILLRNRTCSKH